MVQSKQTPWGGYELFLEQHILSIGDKSSPECCTLVYQLSTEVEINFNYCLQTKLSSTLGWPQN